MGEPYKSAHSGFGIAAFSIALLAGAGLIVAFNQPEQHDPNVTRIFLGKAMVACGFLETIAFTLAGTALTDTRHKSVFSVAAIIVAGVTLAVVIVGLFGD